MVVGFDFDGVIINSLPSMRKSWSDLSNKLNIKNHYSEYINHIGLKFFDILDKLNIDNSLHESIYNEYFSGTKKHSQLIKIYPNALETLEYLKKLKIKNFILTSKPRENTELVLKEYKISVDLLVTGDDVVEGKPSNEGGKIVKSFFKENNIIYTGDMESDRLFAENSNFKFVYASYGYGKLSTYKNVLAKIENLCQIKEIVNSVLNKS